jgi:hypothetical protein
VLKRLFVLSGLVPVVTGLLVAVPATSADAGDLVRVRLHRAVRHLPVAHETRRGYDRDKFRHWVDANGDCQDTRDEVLDAESKLAVSGCAISRGTWFSYYDRVTVHESTLLDIDHLVPLAEAWDSGAKRWNARTRERYANDLRDPRSLVAVTASANRSKSDQDPAEWMPDYGRCRYLRQWVAVKIRWSLPVNRAEKRALRNRASRCANRVVRVRKAAIGTRRAGTGGSTGGTGSTGTTDPRFEYCYQAIDHGYGDYVKGRDPEYWWYVDSDHDGVVCET